MYIILKEKKKKTLFWKLMKPVIFFKDDEL